jgi:hypothetical protein
MNSVREGMKTMNDPKILPGKIEQLTTFTKEEQEENKRESERKALREGAKMLSFTDPTGGRGRSRGMVENFGADPHRVTAQRIIPKCNRECCDSTCTEPGHFTMPSREEMVARRPMEAPSDFDPDACYAEMMSCADAVDQYGVAYLDACARLGTLVVDMNAWLCKGGRLPKAWVCMQAGGL